MSQVWSPSLGAVYLGDDRCRFRVWAPRLEQVAVHLLNPLERVVLMEPLPRGYHEVTLDGVPPGSRYRFLLGPELERPDPASRFQPEGVHGPSEVVPRAFEWHDAAWPGIPLADYIFYELHVGTFTPEGTFEAIIPRLPELKHLGVTALEIMPIAQFPGDRNWGYDGAYPFAAQNSYGGPLGFKRLVDACHQAGLAVVLDVVYNHLGPEGSYAWDYASYFTDRYKTPWGSSVNMDGPDSDEVRRFFIENALQWVLEFHVDALRLDAVHAILDFSAVHFLEELNETVHEQARRANRQVFLIAESDLNDPRLIRPPEIGGYGLDAQWCDDFHHALHALLTGERDGYYQDFGKLEQLAAALRDGFVYAGCRSEFRGRRFGRTPSGVPAHRFVVCTQNHDQVGNRMQGDRLSQLVSFDGLKLAAGVLLLSPYLPLMFMGEEYGETNPFQYFVSLGDPALVEAVRKGRAEEFAEFAWQGDVPDPQSEETFDRSRPRHSRRLDGGHRVMYELYRTLIRLRKELPALAEPSRERLEVISFEKPQVLYMRRWHGEEQAIVLFNFNRQAVELEAPVPSGSWRLLLDTGETRWQEDSTAGSRDMARPPVVLTSDGELQTTLAPCSFLLLNREREASSGPS